MKIEEFLAGTALFFGISGTEIANMSGCLGIHKKTFCKGEFIHRAGDTVSTLGVVVSGLVIIESYDAWGNRCILDHLITERVFAENFACGGEALTVNVLAAENAEIIFINMEKMIGVCSKACAFHKKLISNVLRISAKKNLLLTAKISCISQKTIRARVTSYLSAQADAQKSRFVRIPFNRQELADYLSVERSALSNELSKMQKEGLISYDKNKFTLHRISDIS